MAASSANRAAAAANVHPSHGGATKKQAAEVIPAAAETAKHFDAALRGTLYSELVLTYIPRYSIRRAV